MNGAQNLIRTLVDGGVEVCFTNPGTSEMHFVAALDQVDGMRAVLGLFEGVCTGAADGYARMTGKPASTLLHLGPGLGNGIANLHNARRAHSPMVNIIGEHATYHIKHDAPLTTDIEGLAWPVSGWVRTSTSPDAISQDAAEAITAAMTAPGQIATRISNATGAALMSNRPTARHQLGVDRPVISSLAYPVEQSLQQLQDFAHVILVGTAEPVAFFAYPNKPSQLASPDSQIHTLATAQQDVVGALAALADELGVPAELGACHRFAPPPLPSGALSPDSIWQSVAAQLPEQAIIVNEAVTSSAGAAKWLRNTAQCDMITGTGGAIGHGLAESVGAAVACPDRQVIGMQADGSAMYTIQALWTQAREQLNVVTVLFNNRAYRILQGELKAVGAERKGNKADSILHLDNPQLDFVRIAEGMGVEASRAESAESFNDQLAAALAKSGPHLIEVLV